MQFRVSRGAGYCTQHPSPEQRECRGNGASSWAGARGWCSPCPGSCSGRDHALAALPVGHGPAVVVGSCAFVCFLLPPLLHRLPVLPVALGIPNNSRVVVLVPEGHKKRTSQQAHCSPGDKIPDPHKHQSVRRSALRPRLIPGLPQQPRSSISHSMTLSFHTLSPSAENSYQTVPKSLWELLELCKLCSPRSYLAQGSAAWSHRTRGNGFEKGEI